MTERLIKNRYRPNICSKIWFKYWLKRLLLSKQFILLTIRLRGLRKRGVSVGNENSISPLKLLGSFPKLEIGSNCAIGRVSIQLHDEVKIGDCVVLNDGCQFLTGSHDIESADWKLKTSPIAVGDYAWIATDAMILPGVIIGRGAIVGAGSVVTKSVPDQVVVGGNPAKQIGVRKACAWSYLPNRFSALAEAWLGPITHSRTPVGSRHDGDG
jgi:maltose O-acetyltransferase